MSHLSKVSKVKREMKAEFTAAETQFEFWNYRAGMEEIKLMERALRSRPGASRTALLREFISNGLAKFKTKPA